MKFPDIPGWVFAILASLGGAITYVYRRAYNRYRRQELMTYENYAFNFGVEEVKGFDHIESDSAQERLRRGQARFDRIEDKIDTMIENQRRLAQESDVDLEDPGRWRDERRD